MAAITTSIFDLFKVGPGPSSSHTIGPMKAARDFLHRLHTLPSQTPHLLKSATSIEIFLYGSLAATGKGHGTDRAVVAGLLDWTPEQTEPIPFSTLLSGGQTYAIELSGEKRIDIGAENIHFIHGQQDFPYSNTLILRLMSGETVLHEEEYYSIGGGFIIRKGEPEAAVRGDVPFPYTSMSELRWHLKGHDIALPELILQNEIALTGLSAEEVSGKIDAILDFMHKAVQRGLETTGVLPGSIGLQRKAPGLYQQAASNKASADSFLIFLNAYCLAASEENAAGNTVVTAPTSGASGVIPGISYLLKTHYHINAKALREGMMAAAAIGFLVKHNASISGAEMGCMGEVGSAAAMGAAMICQCTGKGIEAIESAAEIAIEHHLGMTCDPVGGYVQIPCIERNAMGAVKAYNAYLLASSGNPAGQKISLDSVIKVMRATGRDMSKKYKETSEAGLALSATEC